MAGEDACGPETHAHESSGITKGDRKTEIMSVLIYPDTIKSSSSFCGRAARIFADKSYHSTSMRDISRATNVSLAGLYHYCKSKEELLFLIQDNCFGRVLERLEERLRRRSTIRLAMLTIFIENHLSFFAANMAEMKVLSHEAESLQGDLHAHVSGKKDKYTKLASRILREIDSDSSLKQAVDLTVATYALFGMMNWISQLV